MSAIFEKFGHKNGAIELSQISVVGDIISPLALSLRVNYSMLFYFSLPGHIFICAFV